MFLFLLWDSLVRRRCTECQLCKDNTYVKYMSYKPEGKEEDIKANMHTIFLMYS